MDEISLLRQQHKEAIKQCDFNKAKATNDQINKLTNQIKSGKKNQKKLDNEIEYRHVCDRVKSDAADEYNRALQYIYEVRTIFQNRVSILLQTHSEQIQKLYSDYSKALEISATRTVKDADNFTNGAQILGNLHHYEAAQELLNLANDNRELTTIQREEECHLLYNQLKEQMEQKHNEELALNSQKRYQRFVEIKQGYDREIERLRKVLASTSIKLQVKRNIEEEELFFKELVISPDDDSDTDIPRRPLTPLSSFSSPKSSSPSPKTRSEQKSSTYQSPSRIKSSPKLFKSPSSTKPARVAKNDNSPKSNTAKISYKLNSPASPTRK